MATNQLTSSSHAYRMFVFWIGIMATIAYRAIIIVGRYSELWVDIIWYAGTIGFVWYFAHRFHIEEKRDHIITSQNLIKKVKASKDIKKEDREALEYTLKSLVSSKSRWNYIVIFVASTLALIYDVMLRLFSNY